jgi:ribulose-5-phosphate 4-epimerase/fuculose-1-phosphate aldolase
MTVEQARAEICRFCDKVYDKGMVCGTGGNISMRTGDTIQITPSGIPLAGLTLRDLVEVRMDGSYDGAVVPSKETGLHLAAYHAVPDVGAVLHLHSYYSIIAGILCTEGDNWVMPPYTASFAVKVPDLQIIPYSLSGSAELRDGVTACLGRSNAVLLANHGIIVAGKNLQAAFNIAEEVEFNARLHYDLRGRGALSAPVAAATRAGMRKFF